MPVFRGDSRLDRLVASSATGWPLVSNMYLACICKLHAPGYTTPHVAAGCLLNLLQRYRCGSARASSCASGCMADERQAVQPIPVPSSSTSQWYFPQPSSAKWLQHPLASSSAPHQGRRVTGKAFAPFPTHLTAIQSASFHKRRPSPLQIQATAVAHLDPGRSLSQRAAAEEAANPLVLSQRHDGLTDAARGGQGSTPYSRAGTEKAPSSDLPQAKWSTEAAVC
ncbi:uncharacterized protein TrAtP1_000260 [Trichoderma atroviride]|uniref:Uncharacterized protein n=1 Tax=Hypocrea atroviridis (strain ATCC 20476 / IMI 206040) TaxID=452589 RepID=G9NJR6_HYPAI|nr:uncharacterized protein TRIATDRAFT_271151 [Trichoderma atroviride IMI 206040]EHK49139.1 hypothetical protein TRIATDRAFT_271151 [Trichoderma atroviride IMI 206040]UKZ58940.1 hypothetical protein TrAtP1_000260 [Trichoderma atroviride]